MLSSWLTEHRLFYSYFCPLVPKIIHLRSSSPEKLECRQMTFIVLVRRKSNQKNWLSHLILFSISGRRQITLSLHRKGSSRIDPSVNYPVLPHWDNHMGKKVKSRHYVNTITVVIIHIQIKLYEPRGMNTKLMF